MNNIKSSGARQDSMKNNPCQLVCWLIRIKKNFSMNFPSLLSHEASSIDLKFFLKRAFIADDN